MGLTRLSVVRRGFTLIELLVVIAIIALLISVLLPALGAARDAGRTVVCSSTLKELAQGQVQYTLENRDWIACIYTSGADAKYFRGANIIRDTTPTTPTSTWDWISPTMGQGMGLPVNRARRTLALFNTWGCSSAKKINTTLFPPAGGADDRDDFDRAQQELPYRQTSYMMSSGFVGVSRTAGTALSLYTPKNGSGGDSRRWLQFPTPVEVPPTYEPRLDKIGTNPSMKVLACDGTRYYTSSSAGGAIDFDVAPSPSVFGSFSDSMPIYEPSTAFGRSSPVVYPGDRGNLKLSYRHKDTMNAAFFDGSVRRLTQDATYRNVEYWYPSGSKFKVTDATKEAKEKYRMDQIIP